MDLKNFLKEHNRLIIGVLATLILLYIIFPKSNQSLNRIDLDQTIHKKVFDYQSVLNSIEAKSFYVYDIQTDEILFEKDAHLKLPLASIAKLMSGLVVLDILPENTEVTIRGEDIAKEGDSGLFVGEKWRLKDLLDFSLITSSNDGIHAISSAFNYQALNGQNMLQMMNERAKILGLHDTIFINETGLDIDSNISGAYSSAYDVTLLLHKIIKDNQALISNTSKPISVFISESNIKHTAINTNISIHQISGLIASKTGFTGLAGGNLAILFDAGFMHPVSIVVLGSSIDGRFTDLIKLKDLTLEKLSE